MDSPSLQHATSHEQYSSGRQSYPSVAAAQTSPVDHRRGAVQKRSSIANHDRSRSISVSQADRLYRLAAGQTGNTKDNHSFQYPESQSIDPSAAPAPLGVRWITPQHSPQLSGLAAAAPVIDSYPQWTAPTPPRSDSGIPSVPVDSDDPVTTRVSGGHQEFAFSEPAVSAEMSSLGFLLPSQYGASPYESEQSNYPMDHNYIPPMRMSQPPTSSSSPAYAQANTTHAASYQTRAPDAASAGRRQSEMPAPTRSGPQSYDHYRRTSHPYESNGNYSMPPNQTIPSISGLTQSPLPSPHVQQSSGSQMMPQYANLASRSPDMYSQNMYAQPQQYATTAPGAPQLYASSQSYAPPPFVGSSVNEVIQKQPMDSSSPMRVLNQRPKPQCWEHGCNGRQFSTFSNLLRHQREKSGTAAKSYCPKCGAEFTRTTARNGHLQHDKCTKQRRPSDTGK